VTTIGIVALVVFLAGGALKVYGDHQERARIAAELRAALPANYYSGPARDEFMIAALHEVDAIGYNAPPVAPPLPQVMSGGEDDRFQRVLREMERSGEWKRKPAAGDDDGELARQADEREHYQRWLNGWRP
jgi:hypothetical protein